MFGVSCHGAEIVQVELLQAFSGSRISCVELGILRLTARYVNVWRFDEDVPK